MIKTAKDLIILFGLTISFSCQTFDGFRQKPAEKKETETITREKEKKTFKNNVVFEAIDRGTSDPQADRMVYYKIFLNKELVLKTPSGLFFQKKIIETSLEPGRYLFYAERWYLEEDSDAETQEYKRANNVWQMKPVYMDVPEDGSQIHAVFGIDYDKSTVYIDVLTN